MRIANFYTGISIVAPIVDTFRRVIGECEIFSAADDWLVSEFNRVGEVTAEILACAKHLFGALDIAKADVMVCTCSSIGEKVEELQGLYKTPLIRMDGPMAEMAVAQGAHIGLLASAASTVQPSTRLLNAAAGAKGKSVQVQPLLQQDIMRAAMAGRAAEAEELALAAAQKLARENDVLVLAQASLAQYEEKMAALVDVPVLSSPRTCAEYLRSTYA